MPRRPRPARSWRRKAVICGNPAAEGEHPACGPAGAVARVGDPRYSLLAWVHEPHLGSPLGFGRSAVDPETGEATQANAFVYGTGVEELGARRWARGHGRPRSRGDAVGRMAAAKRALARGELLRRDDGQAQARLAALRDTPIETLMTGPQRRFAAGLDPRAPVDRAVLDRACPLSGLSRGRLEALARLSKRVRGERCVLRADDFADDGLLGLARAVAQAASAGDGTMRFFGRSCTLRGADGAVDYEAVRDMLRHPILASTAAHEVGHTLGLRHDLSGSFDALDYGPGYWALRDDGRMAARAWDPLTPAEIDGRIREHQYSTVMDYGNDLLVTDAGGLGHYDRAAIKMGYGDLVEVFSHADDPTEMAWVAFTQLYGWPVAFRSSSFLEGNPVSAYAYADLPGLLGGVDRLEQRADVPYESLREDPTLAADGLDLPLVDRAGRPVVPYRFCSEEISDTSTTSTPTPRSRTARSTTPWTRST